MASVPNILLLIADDHRGSALGALGIEPVHTPTMDHLLARGVCFTQNRHTGSIHGAVCVPARASLHTGLTAGSLIFQPPHQPAQGGQRLPPALPTLGAMLREHGHHAFAVGKWHNDEVSFNRSFDDAQRIFFGGMADHWQTPVHDYQPTGRYPHEHAQYTGEHSTEMFADAAIRFLQRPAARRQPFFLYVAFTSPHDPRTAPHPWDTWYDPACLPLPPNCWAQHPFDLGIHDIRDEVLAAQPRQPQEVQQHLADYYAMLSHQDQQMGRILAALDEAGVRDNTLVIYTADHGLALGQHGLLGKQNLYEHSLRVPLLLSGLDLPAGRRCDPLTHTCDLYPTVCEMLGIPTPAHVEGQSLRPWWRGASAAPRRAVGAFYAHLHRSVTDGRWKLIRTCRTPLSGRGSDHWQLFDLAHDPWEMRNRADDPACQGHFAALRAELHAWQQSVGDPLGPLW